MKTMMKVEEMKEMKMVKMKNKKKTKAKMKMKRTGLTRWTVLRMKMLTLLQQRVQAAANCMC
jgi:hypothetical protein